MSVKLQWREPDLLDILYLVQNCRQQDAEDFLAETTETDMSQIAMQTFNRPGLKVLGVDEKGRPRAMVSLWIVTPSCLLSSLSAVKDVSVKELVRVREKCRELVKATFEHQKNINRIEGMTNATRGGAINFLKSCHLKFESTRKAWGTGGKDFHLFAITRSEWDALDTQ